MRSSSGVIVFTTAAKWCSGVSVVEVTVWVAMVWKRVVAEGVTTRAYEPIFRSNRLYNRIGGVWCRGRGGNRVGSEGVDA
jgi:hypothetical protein